MKRFLCLLSLLLCAALVSGCGPDNLLTRDNMTYRLTDEGAVLTRFTGGAQQVTVPDEVEGHPVVALGEGAFASAKALLWVSLPEGLTEIGSFAFAKCTGLNGVTFRGEALKSIGGNAFAACHALESISLPTGVETIGKSAFSDCRALRRILLPGTLTAIGEQAFSQCGSLTALQIPPSVTELGGNIFSGCPAELVLTVFEDSPALRYAQEYGIAWEIEE